MASLFEQQVCSFGRVFWGGYFPAASPRERDKEKFDRCLSWAGSRRAQEARVGRGASLGRSPMSS
jgi:hypothetical protein